MKQRHIITLVVIAGIISCTEDIPNKDLNNEDRQPQLEDTTANNQPPIPAPWEEEVDTTIFITGQPTE